MADPSEASPVKNLLCWRLLTVGHPVSLPLCPDMSVSLCQSVGGQGSRRTAAHTGFHGHACQQELASISHAQYQTFMRSRAEAMLRRRPVLQQTDMQLLTSA